MENKSAVSLSLDLEKRNEIASFYDVTLLPNDDSYVEAVKKLDNLIITFYKKNKKGRYSVLFQGEDALNEARRFDNSLVAIDPKPEKNKIIEEPLAINEYPQIGSDEVGTGDFFGPIIVVASYAKESDVPSLLALGISDSKKMDDDYILEIGPKLIHSYPYSELSLDNHKYNEVHNDFNMNAIKAKMHNQALLNLKRRFPAAHIYQDQFAEPGLYYSYLKNEKSVLRGINFSVKGESRYISVALSSVIARYAFLRKMQKMNEKYGLVFPLGAGKKVDDFVLEFLESHDKKELNEIAKLNFQNYKKLL